MTTYFLNCQLKSVYLSLIGPFFGLSLPARFSKNNDPATVDLLLTERLPQIQDGSYLVLVIEMQFSQFVSI